MFDFLETIINEIKSYFVTENISYKITGECKKCGKCCNYMYSFDTYTEKEFKIMQFIFPAYKRFYIKGKDEDGNLIFACKYVTKEGLCSVYDKRLKMCKNGLFYAFFVNWTSNVPLKSRDSRIVSLTFG